MNTRSAAVLPGAWGQGKRTGYRAEARAIFFLRLLIALVVSLTAITTGQAQGEAASPAVIVEPTAWEAVAKVIV